ncbi:MAG TPA: T9SS type A sorting domain-containing protein, partial [Flavobacterium sp.]|nr:T9SS type A sorting domain-containing protein [Flavobacterium sp.]
TVPRHSYNVGSDFNHQQPRTKEYVKRVVRHWIEEYKIDGFRWDLTKGFTQNCPSNVEGGQLNCTQGYQQDRVDVLKEYADYSWSLDATHYTIFEHLGDYNEQKEWANHRINETPSKGILLWEKFIDQYSQLSMGYKENTDIEWMGYDKHGIIGKRIIGYPESHDEERQIYNTITYGNSANASHNVKNLNTALSRMSAIGAISLLIPGPKMIWHFGALGWEKSIYTCNNGTINNKNDAIPEDCKLDKKPQPQWVENWLGDPNRNKIYYDWAKMNTLKTEEPIFNVTITANSGFDIQSGNTVTPRLFLWDNTMASSQLKNVVILTNFDVVARSITPDFPYTGTWYNLMDNSSIEVTNTTAFINIEPGGFRIFGNQPTSVLSNDNFEKLDNTVYLYPNPTSNTFTINSMVSKVQIFSLSGQLVKNFDGTDSNNQQFSISELNNGLYFVKAFNDKNEVKVMKLLKQ